jgi:hypothetical protein
MAQNLLKGLVEAANTFKDSPSELSLFGHSKKIRKNEERWSHMTSFLRVKKVQRKIAKKAA